MPSSSVQRRHPLVEAPPSLRARYLAPLMELEARRRESLERNLDRFLASGQSRRPPGAPHVMAGVPVLSRHAIGFEAPWLLDLLLERRELARSLPGRPRRVHEDPSRPQKRADSRPSTSASAAPPLSLDGLPSLPSARWSSASADSAAGWPPPRAAQRVDGPAATTSRSEPSSSLPNGDDSVWSARRFSQGQAVPARGAAPIAYTEWPSNDIFPVRPRSRPATATGTTGAFGAAPALAAASPESSLWLLDEQLADWQGPVRHAPRQREISATSSQSYDSTDSFFAHAEALGLQLTPHSPSTAPSSMSYSPPPFLPFGQVNASSLERLAGSPMGEASRAKPPSLVLQRSTHGLHEPLGAIGPLFESEGEASALTPRSVAPPYDFGPSGR